MQSDEVAEAAKELGMMVKEVMLLRHMILAHHGKMEFGSPKLPHLKEAEILFFIDNIDAKMNMFEKAFKKTDKGQFTEKFLVWKIDNSTIRKIRLFKSVLPYNVN